MVSILFHCRNNCIFPISEALNAEKIGTSAHGTAEFTIDGDTMHIKIEMFDTPANTEHWQHFHGFTDGKDAIVATMERLRCSRQPRPFSKIV